MTTLTRDARPVKPVPQPRPRPRPKPAAIHGIARWLDLPVRVRDFEIGTLRVNDVEYVVTLPADRSGARLTKDRATVYHVDLAKGECDCPDAQYRKRACKHVLAVRAAVATLTPAALPTVASPEQPCLTCGDATPNPAGYCEPCQVHQFYGNDPAYGEWCQDRDAEAVAALDAEAAPFDDGCPF